MKLVSARHLSAMQRNAPMSLFTAASRREFLCNSILGKSVLSTNPFSGQRAFFSVSGISRRSDLPQKSAGFQKLSTTAATPLKLSLQSSRFLSTTRLLSLRESYFQRPLSKTRSGYGGRGGGGRSWWQNFRRRLDNLPPMYVVYGLIGINVAIYGLWQYAQTSWQRFRDPSLYYWMSRNFIVSEANFAAGRM